MNYQKAWPSEFPKQLFDLPDPPKQLYYRGHFDRRVFENCASVVGSRRITEYGKKALDKLIPSLVFSGKTVVSGFMFGVDQTAHKVALEGGGKTIAILGFGISVPMEARDAMLAEKIIDSGGLVISEWEEQKATLWTFPRRNRIVAALSKEVYVVEAATESGSMITANLARKLKRELFAIPGPITSKVSEGTNALIREGRAKMWTGEGKLEKKLTNDPILELLENESLTTDEIARKLGVGVDSLGAELSMLVLSGQILENQGKYSNAS